MMRDMEPSRIATPRYRSVRPRLLGSQSVLAKPTGIGWVVVLVVALSVASAVLVQGASTTARDYAAAVVVLAALVVAAGALYFLNTKLWFDGIQVGRRDFLRRSRMVSAAELQEMRLCSVKSAWNARPLRAIVFVDRASRAPIRLSGFFWNADDLAAFADGAGLSLAGSWQNVAVAEELENAVPGSVSWVERSRDNSFLAAGAIVVGSLALYFLARWAVGI
jgi:hypothetical protein